MKSLQASLRRGIPNNTSTNVVSITTPLRRKRLGALNLLVEGANPSMRHTFGNSLVSAYYRQSGESIEANVALATRTALSAAAGQRREDDRSELGFSLAIATDQMLHIFQLPPALAFFVRGGQAALLPPAEPGAAALGRVDRSVEHYSTALEPDDVVVLVNSSAGAVLSNHEVSSLYSRRQSAMSPVQLVLLLRRRGVTDCDVMVLHSPTLPPPPAARPEMRQRLVPEWRRRPVAERVHPGIEDADPVELLLADEARAVVVGARAERTSGVRTPGRLNALANPGARARGARSGSGWSPTTRIRRLLFGEPRPIAVEDSYVAELASRNRVDNSAEQPVRDLFEELPGADVESTFGGLSSETLARRRNPGRRLGLGAALFVLALAVLLLVVLITGLRTPNQSAVPSPFQPVVSSPAPAAVEGVGGGRGFTRAQEILADAGGQTDDGQALVLLLEAQSQARLAADLGASQADVDALLAQIAQEQDRRNRVYRLATSRTLGDLGGDIGRARGNQLEAVGGVYYVLSGAGNELIEIAEPGVAQVAQLDGTAIAGQELTALVARPLGLLLISTQGTILNIEPDTTPARLVVLDPSAWSGFVDVDNFQNNLYRLQPELNQIFKYTPTTLGYELEPVDFFEQPTDIGSAIDMAIDGDIYLLLADNTIKRLRVGQQITFEVSGIDKPLTGAALIYTDQRLESVYVVDAGFNRIVELDKRAGREGEFKRQFLYTGADDFFADIRGIWVDEVAGVMVVLGSDSLREFVLPPLATAPGS